MIKTEILEEVKIEIEKIKDKNNTPSWIASYDGGITCGLEKVLDLLEKMKTKGNFDFR